jgi:hypothetical protein
VEIHEPNMQPLIIMSGFLSVGEERRTSKEQKMNKPRRLIPIGLALVLAIPVFRFLCEKFRTCQAIRAYTIVSKSEPLFVGLV